MEGFFTRDAEDTVATRVGILVNCVVSRAAFAVKTECAGAPGAET